MRFLVLGTGSVGGYVGIRLVEAGLPVTFLVRQHRIKQLKSVGLSLKSAKGGWHGMVDCVERSSIEQPFDVIILACKAFDLDQALHAITPAVGRDTVIIPFLNGMSHLRVIRDNFPLSKVWGGVAHIAVTNQSPNHIIHLNELQNFCLGPLEKADIAEDVFETMSVAEGPSFELQYNANIIEQMWEKWVFLATLAGITCTMRQDIGTILDTRHGATLIRELFAECCAIAAAEGTEMSASAKEFYSEPLFTPGSKLTSSMLRDIQSGRRTEHAHIISDLIDRARSRGLPTPILTLCLTHLEAYDRGRNASANA